MPVGGDIIELVHEQTYLSQQVNNVYYFESIDGSTPLSTLAAWFETNVIPAMNDQQNDRLQHVNLRLRNLFDEGETYEEPLAISGGTGSLTEELPSFMAVSIRFDHTSGDVRPGFKRIAGLNEFQIQDALWVAATITALEDYANLLINPPSIANPGWAHVIVGRHCEELNPVVGAVPRCFKYILPRTQVEAANAGVGTPVSYEIYTQPTTQNSRKWYT